MLFLTMYSLNKLVISAKLSDEDVGGIFQAVFEELHIK
jgi:hypothetical protein